MKTLFCFLSIGGISLILFLWMMTTYIRSYIDRGNYVPLFILGVIIAASVLPTYIAKKAKEHRSNRRRRR